VVTFVLIAQIILAILLVVLVVLQTQSSGAGSMFGSDTSVYRTRRGLEKTLYQATIGVSIVFIVISILSVLVAG
jgi:preprotein translocase subunit SecG